MYVGHTHKHIWNFSISLGPMGPSISQEIFPLEKEHKHKEMTTKMVTTKKPTKIFKPQTIFIILKIPPKYQNPKILTPHKKGHKHTYVYTYMYIQKHHSTLPPISLDS